MSKYTDVVCGISPFFGSMAILVAPRQQNIFDEQMDTGRPTLEVFTCMHLVCIACLMPRHPGYNTTMRRYESHPDGLRLNDVNHWQYLNTLRGKGLSIKD